MRKLRVGILDLVTKVPTRTLWARVVHPSFASIMPQAIAVWSEKAGHDVTFVCYTGFENLLDELPDNLDVLFVGAFSQAGQLSYALSNMFRRRGCVTVLGGPHARCYPDDARKYFDYVLGFTDQEIVARILEECCAQRPYGEYLAASRQPRHLPGVRERWKYIKPTIMKSPTRIKGVPMIGSLGCPYTCSFCIDSTVPYQPMDYDEIRDDLRFLVNEMPQAWIAWHDPNFGVRFDDYMGVIEEAVPPGTLTFAAESSLSLLSEDRVRRLGAANFKLMLPGIESWYSFGNKSKTGGKTGIDKMEHVSDHVNMILEHIPYVQTNFVIGLDDDEGAEPFELTKKFLYRTPGAFPGYSLLSCFGEAAPLNIDLQRSGRVRPFPFHFLNNNQAMNVQPKNIRVGHVLRPPHRPLRVLILAAYHGSALPGHSPALREGAQHRQGGVVGGLRPHQVSQDNPPHVEGGSPREGLLRGRDRRGPTFLRGPHPARARTVLGGPARGGVEPRPKRVREKDRPGPRRGAGTGIRTSRAP